MAAVVVLAIYLPQTIWQLILIKLELLMQIAPALLLGLHMSRLRTQPVFWGFVAGVAVTLYFLIGAMMTDSITNKPLGIHAGLLGLIVNLVVVGGLSVGY